MPSNFAVGTTSFGVAGTLATSFVVTGTIAASFGVTATLAASFVEQAAASTRFEGLGPTPGIVHQQPEAVTCTVVEEHR